jgi:hypothetical protein
MKRVELSKNYGKPYTDDALMHILSTAPLSKNAEWLAQLYGRNPGAILQIWAWAAVPVSKIKQKESKSHYDNKFFKQIKRVARLLGYKGRGS